MSHDPGDEDRGTAPRDDAPGVPSEIIDRLLPAQLAFRAAFSRVTDDTRWDALALHAAGIRDAIRSARAGGKLRA